MNYFGITYESPKKNINAMENHLPDFYSFSANLSFPKIISLLFCTIISF